MTSKETPRIIYGTAWKKERTADLVRTALAAGFRALDTANQPKHYDEALVGEAWTASGIARQNLFLQTKFTPPGGQDHRIPYDVDAPHRARVMQSFEASLANLRTEYLDSYLLHGPQSYPGLGEADWEVWGAMEELAGSGKARAIGISNVNAAQLEELIERAEVQPSFVQNRCLAAQGGWDAEVRQLCRKTGVRYQGFWLLTGNRQILPGAPVQAAAHRLHKTPQQVLYRFAIELGIIPLTGTTNEQHMREALETLDCSLTEQEVQAIAAQGR